MWLVVVVAWLADISGLLAAGWGAQIAVACTLLASLIFLGRTIWDATTGESDASRASRALLAIVLTAIVVRFVGLGHELAEHYYLDEGTYYANATRINEGRFLQPRFVYPHLLYYLDAFVLWAADLFQPAVAWGIGALTGFREWIDVEWYLLRSLNALLAALVAIPVFRVAERVAGLAAGVLGGLLIAFSPLINEGAHVNISDVPSAFFAACSLFFAARLLDEERRRDYLLAGVFAGLAAGTKYPAGVVAVAIVAAWVRSRWRSRKLSFDLLWSGLAALGVFVLCTPSLLAFPDIAFFSKQGIFFGVRQYGGGGWIGVMPASNTAFYALLVVGSFGLPALGAAVVGLFGLERQQRAHLAWLSVFPAVYFVLIARMNMVVERNLYPAVPALAACLGIAAAGCALLLARQKTQIRRTLASLVMVGILAIPIATTIAQAIGFARPSTRQAAAAWTEDHVPPGARILKESYTPHLPAGRFVVRQERFAAKFSLSAVRRKDVDFLLLSGNAYHRFLDPGQRTAAHHEEYAAFYEAVFAEFEEVREFAPGRFRRGPRLRYFSVDPVPVRYLSEREFRPGAAFASSGRMVPDGASALVFSRPEHWAAFKDYFEAGEYRAEIIGDELKMPGILEVRERLAPGKSEYTIEAPDATRLSLGADGKYFFYLRLPAGGRVRALRVVRTGPA